MFRLTPEKIKAQYNRRDNGKPTFSELKVTALSADQQTKNFHLRNAKYTVTNIKHVDPFCRIPVTTVEQVFAGDKDEAIQRYRLESEQRKGKKLKSHTRK